MAFWKRQTLDIVKGSVVARGSGRGQVDKHSETNLYDAIIMDTRHYAFVKTHKTLQHKEGILMYEKI